MLISLPNASVINYTPDHAMAPMESLRIEMVFYDNKPTLLAGAIASQSGCPHSPQGLKLLRFTLNDRIVCFLPSTAVLTYSAHSCSLGEGKESLIPHRKPSHCLNT